MPEYNRPKLFEALKYGGECVVCGDEIEKGVPGWVHHGTCACATHKPEAVIDAVDALKKEPTSPPSSTDQTALVEGLKGIDESLARIAHILGMIYSNGGLPK